MRIPNQVNPVPKATISSIPIRNTNKSGVRPAACCAGNPNPVCNIFGRINCPPGFACRQSRICGGDVCFPVAFCVAQNLTLGFG